MSLKRRCSPEVQLLRDQAGQNLVGVMVALALGSAVIYLSMDLIQRTLKRSPDDRLRVTLQEYRNAVLNRVMNDPESWALTVDATENNPTPAIAVGTPPSYTFGNYLWCVSRDPATGQFRSETPIQGLSSAPGECPSRVQREMLKGGVAPSATPLWLFSRAGVKGSSNKVVFYDPTAQQGITVDGSPCTFDPAAEGACLIKPQIELVGIECDTSPFGTDPSDAQAIHQCTQPNFKVRLSFQLSEKGKRLFPGTGGVQVGRDYNDPNSTQDKYSAVLLVPAPARRGCYPDNRSGGACFSFDPAPPASCAGANNVACSCGSILCQENPSLCPGGAAPASVPLTLRCAGP
jgi:hypothetical protein